MNTYTVFGHVLAKKLPTGTAVIGDGWLRFLPGSPRDGGGTSLQHATMDPDVDYASTVPAHTMIHSRWQVGFRNVSAHSDEEAVEKVRRTRIPQFKAAYHFATGDTIDVVVSGFGVEQTDESWSPWSPIALFHFKIPEELKQEDILRANSVTDLLQTDGGASRAASLLAQAEWALTSSGGIVAFQAAAVLDAVRAIERIAQVLGKKPQASPPNPADDAKVRNYLLELRQAFSTDSDFEKQLKIVKKISTRAVEVLDQGTLSKLKHASHELGISPSDFKGVKRLWHLRNNKLAHPGKLPDDLGKEARDAIRLGRKFLDAYLEKRLADSQ